jgi:hypothetical protein
MARNGFVGREEILGSYLSTKDLNPVRRGSGAFLGLEEILTSGDDESGLEEILTSGIGRLEILGRDEILGREEILGRDEILGREEILGSSFVGSRHRRRGGGGGQDRIQRLKTKAASGDQKATARLQQLQTELASPTTTTTPVTSASSTPVSPPYQPYPSVAATTPVLSQSYASQPYAQTVQSYPQQYGYQQQYGYPQQYGYQDPYGYQQPYGPPTIDVYQGDLGHEEILGGSFVGDDERMAAEEGSASDRQAMRRRSASAGWNRHWAYIRGDETPTGEQLEELKTRALAGDHRAIALLKKLREKASASSSGWQWRHVDNPNAKEDRERRLAAAKKILKAAATAGQISRPDLKRAIDTCSEPGASDADKFATGKKIVGFLGKKGVAISAT